MAIGYKALSRKYRKQKIKKDRKLRKNAKRLAKEGGSDGK